MVISICIHFCDQGDLNLKICSGVGTMGTGGTLYPQFRSCTPCTPQVKDAAYVKILSKRL